MQDVLKKQLDQEKNDGFDTAPLTGVHYTLIAISLLWVVPTLHLLITAPSDPGGIRWLGLIMIWYVPYVILVMTPIVAVVDLLCLKYFTTKQRKLAIIAIGVGFFTIIYHWFIIPAVA